jgi:hypothetical protein
MDWDKHKHFARYFVYLPNKNGEDQIIATRSALSQIEVKELYEVNDWNDLEEKYSVIYPESSPISITIGDLKKRFTRSTTLDPAGNRVVDSREIIGTAGNPSVASSFTNPNASPHELEFRLASSEKSINSFAVTFMSHDISISEVSVIAYGPDRYNRSGRLVFELQVHVERKFFDDLFENVRADSKISLRLRSPEDRGSDQGVRYLPQMFRVYGQPHILFHLEKSDFVNANEVKEAMQASPYFKTTYSSDIEFTP